MSLLRRLQLFHRAHLLGGAARAVMAALLLAASLAQPGAVPVLAAPAPVAPLAPQDDCTVVWNNLDNLTGHTLREAVACATNSQTVTFQSGVAGEAISLLHGEIPITQSITIDGSNAPGIIVDAGNASRVFNITASGPVTLTALVLQHGKAASGNGGAVLAGASSPLVLNQMQVLSSTAPAGQGGGLYAAGTLTLINTDFISNASASHGGGAWASSAALLTNGQFQGNKCTGAGCQGGGLAASGTLTLTGTDFSGNSSILYGGGAAVGGDAVLTDGQFQGNQCTGVGCQGGGLAAGAFPTDTLTLNSTDFISNTSTSNGGAAFTAAAALLTNGSFQGNKCTASGCLGGGLYVSSTLTAANTDFINNRSGSSGGGAYVPGPAVLTNGSFQGNKCTAFGCKGGGLYAALLTLTGTDFITNTSAGVAGGVWVDGNAVLTNGQFQGNKCTASNCQGGGLNVDGLTLTGTQFISNSSAAQGGGAWANSAAVVTNAQFLGNKCANSGCFGGGLYASSTLMLTGTEFISNNSTSSGGGAFALGAALLTNDQFQGNQCSESSCLGGGLLAIGAAQVLSSSFSGNQSSGSGGAIGITSTAQVTLANVTLAGNVASVSGGGLYAGATSTASLYNVTVADNQAPSGGGVLAEISATLGVTNTLFSNNGANTCAGSIVAGTHNLEFPGNTCATAGPSAGFTTADPLLAPLALNAPGTTLTQALLPGSPARDHADPVSCANSLVNNLDQRGAVRPDAGGEACDIGAFEAGPPDWLVFLPLVRR